MGVYENAQSLRRPSGAIIVDGIQVADTAQCVHCNGHFTMIRGSGAVRGWCPSCGGMICGPKCAVCVPFEKKLDMWENGQLKR